MTTRAADPTLIVDVHTNADTLPPDAQELFATAERRNVECGLTWYRILGEQVVGTGVRFLVLRRKGLCVAAIALNVGPDPGALSNYYTAFYEPALAPGIQASDLVPQVHALRAQSRGAGRYNFAPMDPQSPPFQLLERALALGGLVTFRYFRFGNWYASAHGSWQFAMGSNEDHQANLPGADRSCSTPSAKNAEENVTAKSVIALVTSTTL